MKYTEAYRSALAIQRLVASVALGQSDARVLPSLARAFVELEQLKRNIRGKPNPRPVDVTVPVGKRKLKADVAFTED